jgi:hypothetical protein
MAAAYPAPRLSPSAVRSSALSNAPRASSRVTDGRWDADQG